MPIGDAADTALGNKKRRELARETASYRAAARPVVKKKKGYDPVTNFVRQAKKVYDTVDKAGDAMWDNTKSQLVPSSKEWKQRRAYEKKMAMRGTPVKNAQVISNNMLANLLLAGRGVLRSGTAEEITEGLPQLKQGLGRIGNFHQLDFKPPSRDPSRPGGWFGPANRTPWLVHKETGRVYLGPTGSEHGDIGRELARRGDRAGAVFSGDRKYYEGWLYDPKLPDEPGHTLKSFPIELSTRGLQGYMPPENLDGLEQLIRFLTRNLTDDQIHVKGGANKMQELLEARQGRHRVQRLNEILKKDG